MTIEIPTSLSQSQSAVDEPDNKRSKLQESIAEIVPLTILQVSQEEPIEETDEMEVKEVESNKVAESNEVETDEDIVEEVSQVIETAEEIDDVEEIAAEEPLPQGKPEIDDVAPPSSAETGESLAAAVEE